MDNRLRAHFDAVTLERGRDYVRRGLVRGIEPLSQTALRARVSNGRGTVYRQEITLGPGVLDGACSCPVGHNCKHVAAAMMALAAGQGGAPALAAPVQGWLSRVQQSAAATPAPEARPEDYPDNVKDRLLYVLVAHGPQLRVDIYKGRINAAGTGLNKAIRRYDAAQALRSASPAKFIRPVDLELLAALAQSRLWEMRYSYGLPEIFRPQGKEAIALLRRLAGTGRLLHDTAPGAQLSWSEEEPAPRLAWQMAADGRQRLGFEDAAGRPLDLRGVEGATLWIDPARGIFGALAQAVELEALRLVESGPSIAPDEAQALAASLPDRLHGLALPPPRTVRQIRRKAQAAHGPADAGARDGARRAAIFQ